VIRISLAHPQYQLRPKELSLLKMSESELGSCQAFVVSPKVVEKISLGSPKNNRMIADGCYLDVMDDVYIIWFVDLFYHVF
jgi:hypothetical protein